MIVGALYVVEFRMPKPTNKELAALVVLVGVALSVIVVYSRYAVRVGREDAGASELVTESWLEDMPETESMGGIS